MELYVGDLMIYGMSWWEGEKTYTWDLGSSALEAQYQRGAYEIPFLFVDYQELVDALVYYIEEGENEIHIILNLWLLFMYVGRIKDRWIKSHALNGLRLGELPAYNIIR